MISRWVIYFSLTFTILNSALGSEFGEGCVTLPVDSCNSTAFLKCNVLGPSGSTCGCDTEIAVENPNEKGTCIKLPDKLGQDCQILNGTFEMCSKIDGAMCNGTICVCSDLYFEAGAQCHKYTESLYENCNISLTGQCDKILEENGAHCDPMFSKCLCNAGTHLESFSRKKCLKYRQNIGDPCEAVHGSENLCARISGGGAICNTVNNSTCTCDVLNNYFLHPNGTQCLKYADALNATCEVGTEMCAQIEGAECNTVTGKCNCDPDHATDMTDVKCVPFINNVGGNCSQSTIPDQCSKIDGAECNTNNSTCLCDSSHFPLSSLCHPLATKPNDLCLMNEHCIGVEHTICIGSECTCDPYNGWEPSNEGTCVKLAENVNEVCTTPQGCRQIPGTQCLNSTCQCLPNYVESTTGKLCLIAVDKLGATCSETPQCRMGIGNNSLCISAAGCGCESGYVGEVVDGGKDRCSLEVGYINSTCESNAPCEASLGPNGDCINGRCGCNTLSGYINNRCARKIFLHETCTIHDECIVGSNSNAQCISNSCECISGKEEVNGKCFGSPRIGDECAETEECSYRINGSVSCTSGTCKCLLFATPSIDLLTCAANLHNYNWLILIMFATFSTVQKWL